MRVAEISVTGLSRAWLAANQGRVRRAAEHAANGELVAVVLGKGAGGAEVCATFAVAVVYLPPRFFTDGRAPHHGGKRVDMEPAGPLDRAAISGLGLDFGTGRT